MRFVPTGLANFLKAGEGIESVLALSIGRGGRWLADKTVGNAYSGIVGKIVNCSPVESVMRLDKGGGGAGQVTVVLDNTDNEMEYVKLNEYIFTPVSFRQYFYSRALNGTITDRGYVDLYTGHITTPVKWNEKDRTVTLTIAQSIKSSEAGYAIEDILGKTNSDVIRLLGQPLPMIFGHVYHSPCTRITLNPTIWTKEGFGLVDKTIDRQIAKLQSQIQVINPIYDFGTESVSAPFQIVGDWTPSPEAEAQLQAALAAQAQNAKIQQDINNLMAEKTNQIRLAGSGNVPLQLSAKLNSSPGDCKFRVDNLVFDGHLSAGALEGTMHRQTVKGPGETFQQWIAEGFKWIRAGSRVQIISPYDVYYCASTTPGTVNQVWAKRSVGGEGMLCPVPASWYRIEAIGVMTCVVLNMPLSSRDWLLEQQRIHFENLYGKYLPIHVNQPFDWEEDLWVEFTGSIGPNPVDIIEWLLQTFSPGHNLNIDKSGYSDGYASGRFAAFPMNFMIAVKEDCIKLIQDIAYQCNSIIYMREDELWLRFLPIGGMSTYDIVQSDILYGSLSIETSNIDEIYTRAIATCRVDYSPYFDKPVTLRATHNIAKYGTITDSHDYFAYTSPSAVDHVMSYWLALNSDVRLRISMQVMPWHIGIESLDYVNTPYGFGVVYSAQYDSASNTNNLVIDIYPALAIGAMHVNTYWPDYVTVDPGSGGEPSGGEIRPDVQFPGIQYNYVWPDNKKMTDGKSSGDNASYFPPNPDEPFLSYIPDGPVSEFSPDTPPLAGSYQYNDYKPISIPSTPSFRVAPCRVDSKNERSKYNVTAYLHGRAGRGSSIVAEQMQIADDDEIPAGSWCFLIGVRNEAGIWNYYIQVPVWLG